MLKHVATHPHHGHLMRARLRIASMRLVIAAEQDFVNTMTMAEGVLAVLGGFHIHFQLRDYCHDTLAKLLASPPEGCLMILSDFKERSGPKRSWVPTPGSELR
jgi:hypothetical protein